ncbi:MAG TPA: ankyrin repeat domain-containing protein [Gammaproteobacteria bacterium]|nr:ankyrin repeat domain-containing protein [Gammaproteobacteria bacterium]
MNLICVIKNNDGAAFKDLLREVNASGNRAMIDEVDKLGNGPVHWAAMCGHAHFIEPLLEAGADVGLANLQGVRPIHLAAENGQLAVIRALKETNANIDVTTPAGATPAHIAAMQDRIYTMNELIAVGANIDIPMGDGATPLYIAAMNGFVNTMTVLLDAGANANVLIDENRRLLEQVANNVKTKRLLDKHFKYYPTGIKHRVFKPYQSRRAEVKLLESQVLPELETIRDVDKSVFNAALIGDLDLISAFRTKGVNIDRRLQNGITPLYVATVMGHVTVMRIMLDAGANANIVTVNGSILDAAKRGTQQIHVRAEMLLEAHLAKYPRGICTNELERAQTTIPFLKAAPVCSQSLVAKNKRFKKSG